MKQRYWLLVATLSGLAWVSIGAAMGHDVLSGQALVYFAKAQRYHIVHTLALLWLASWAGISRWTLVASLWALGVLLFSGSLYLMAIVGWPLNYIVPFGGMAMLIGWMCLTVLFWRTKAL